MICTQSKLKELFSYDPTTGIFTHKTITTSKRIGQRGGHLKKSNGYRFLYIDGRYQREHRMAYLYMTGEYPEVIDHVNGIKDDNRWDNIRNCTQAQNTYNTKTYNTSKLGVKGVSTRPSGNFVARIMHNYHTYTLGTFDNLELAVFVRDETAAKLHGDFATTH